MKIGYLQRSSLIDYPTKISAIVFTQGCNFRCPYCHNPELVDPKLFIDPMAIDEVFAFLKKRQGLLDAVVITGGEPTLHKDLPQFVYRLKDMGYLVKIDTNGTNPNMINKLLSDGAVDYIAMDIKAPIKDYENVVKVEVDKDAIVSSIKMIMDSDIGYEFRTTLSGSLLAPSDVTKIALMIRGARSYALQRFVSSKHLDEDFIKEHGFSSEAMAELEKEIAPMVQELVIR